VAGDKIYKTNYEFTSVTTNTSGGLAVGSMNGDVRLYSKVGQIAKTALPGMGEPINSLDVSNDGKWVLATCQTYLLLIPTECNSGKLGFDQRMGAEKPNPKKLTLRPTDRAKWKVQNLNFTPARFNNGEGNETSIVTSSGDILVTWNFKKILKGVLNDYKIKKLHSAPVDN